MSVWDRMYQKVIRADCLIHRADTLTFRSHKLILRRDKLWSKSDTLRVFCDTSIGRDPKKDSSNYLFNASKHFGTSSNYLIGYFEL